MGSTSNGSNAAASDTSKEFELDMDPLEYELAQQTLGDPIVTIDRKKAVYGSCVGIAVLGFVVLAGSVCLFGNRALRDVDGFMLFLLGLTTTGVCTVVFIWIRARWICVAVLDESGVIATTLERKYDLSWGELAGARSYVKTVKDAKQVQVKVLLLLEDGRCLEAPVDSLQLSQLLCILASAEFSPASEGQRLGYTKALTFFVFGLFSVVLGTWWAGHVVDQYNNGVLFQGNIKVILLKFAAAIAGPVGGLGCTGWGLYHAFARPILYRPGWIPSHE